MDRRDDSLAMNRFLTVLTVATQFLLSTTVRNIVDKQVCRGYRY